MRKSFNQFQGEFSIESFTNYVISRVESEIGSRHAHRSQCTIVNVPSKSKNAFVPKGAVMALITKKGDKILKKVADGIEKDDDKLLGEVEKEFDAIDKKLNSIIKNAKVNDVDSAIDDFSLDNIPTLGEIRYDDKTLVNYCTVSSNLPVNVQLFPYNGGALDVKRFSFIEYRASEAKENNELDCVLIIRKPVLSKIEEQALNLVPSSSTSLNIGTSLVGFIPLVVAAAVFVADVAVAFAARKAVRWLANAVAVGVVTWVVKKVMDKVFGAQFKTFGSLGLLDNTEVAELLKNMPAEATATELLQLRKNILQVQLS